MGYETTSGRQGRRATRSLYGLRDVYGELSHGYQGGRRQGSTAESERVRLSAVLTACSLR